MLPLNVKFSVNDPTAQFNHSVLVDLFYTEAEPVIHTVDEATRFQAAQWLPNISTRTFWNCIHRCWIDTYLGPPDIIKHDAGTQFTSREFKKSAALLSISAESVPVEAHSSIGIVERYHGPLRRAYLTLNEELGSAADVSKHMILQMAVKAVNDTASLGDLVPTLVVFRVYTRMTKLDLPAPETVTHAKAV